MAADLRATGLGVIGNMPWGTHFCLFYETRQDLLDALIPYFKAGLANNEFLLCMASPPLDAQEAQRAMQEAVPDFEQHLAEGQIEIVSPRDWLPNGGQLDIHAVRRHWIAKLDLALSKGYAGLRFAGDTSWLDAQARGGVPAFEKQLDRVVSNSQMLGLCAYAVGRCSAADVLDLVHHHQFTVAKGNGAWVHLEGSELKRAHDDIRQLNADLERHVAERTAQLAATNEQLKVEIIERKQAEALLHARDQEFRAFVENAPDQIIRYDRELRRTYVNPAVSAAYGLPREAFIGKRVGSIVSATGPKVDADQVTAIKRQIQSVFDTAQATEFEVTVPSPGASRTYWTRLYPELEPNGMVINVLAISRDITDRNQAEHALRRSEETFKALFASAPVGIAMLDHERRIVDMNPVLAHIMRISKEGLLAGAYRGRTYIRPDGTPKPFSEWASERAINENQPIYGVETGIVLEDGQLIWVQVNAVPLDLPDASAVVITQDITERKRAEEALRESEETFSAAFRASPLALVIATMDGKYVEMNQAFCDQLGYSRAELLGASASDLRLLSAEARQEWVEALGREGGAMTNMEVTYRARNGVSRTMLASVETITLHGVPHRLATSLDITERKQADAVIRSLLQISERLHATLDIDELLDALVIEAMKLIDAEIGWSGLRTEEGMVCRTHITRDLQVVPFEYVWPPGVGLPGWVLVHKVPYVMNDAQSDELIIPEMRARFGVSAAIDTPILDSQGEAIGFFEVNNKKNGARFSESDVAKLVAVSRIASIALQNARLFEAVSEHRRQLLVLSARLAEAQETERRGIARELHDEFGQSLTALKIDLAWLRDHLPARSKRLREKVESALDLANQTIEMTKRLASQLRPSMLDDLGLAPALEWHVNEWSKHTRIKAQVAVPQEEWELDPSVNTVLYRVCQEALTNVIRHAGASRVQVALAREGDEAVLTVRDDGRGMDEKKITAPESLGLLGMKERVEQIGGRLEVQSEASKGTTVVARVPVSPSPVAQPSRPFPKERGQAGKMAKRRGVVEGGLDPRRAR